jgi:hypothetical protein
MKTPENNEMRKILFESYNKFDKELITLTSSAIALSFFFIEKFTNTPLALMVVIWICLSLSLLVQIGGHLATVYQAEAYIDGIEDPARRSLFAKTIWAINGTSFILFSLSVILFIVASSLTLYEKQRREDNKYYPVHPATKEVNLESQSKKNLSE